MSDDGQDADPLALEALDTASLRQVLLNVEKAVPDLLVDIKPILAYLGANHDDEQLKLGSQEAVERYLTTLDKIQYILRHAVFYLREIKASPSVLRPPVADSIPHPLAATLRDTRGAGGAEAHLGLYAQRQEVAALQDMLHAIRTIKRVQLEGGQGVEGL